MSPLQVTSSSWPPQGSMPQLAEMDLPPQLRFANYRGASPFLDLRPLQANAPSSFLSPDYRPLSPENLLGLLQQSSSSVIALKSKALQALDSSLSSCLGPPSSSVQWSIWVDGSYVPSVDAATDQPADTSRSGWSYVLCKHPLQLQPESYQITEIAFGSVEESDFTRYGCQRKGSEVAEAIAVHHAVQRALLLPGQVTIYFDSKLAAHASFGGAEASPQIQFICRATGGFILWRCRT